LGSNYRQFCLDRKRGRQSPSPTVVRNTRISCSACNNFSHAFPLLHPRTPRGLEYTSPTHLLHRAKLSVAPEIYEPQSWHQENGVRHVLDCARKKRCRTSRIQRTTADFCGTDDEDEESTPPSSPPSKPIARRGKFDDEEEDSDVRQPSMPRRAQLLPRHAQMYTY
jgi:hypothetical protein